jgi:ABC-type nitrate/sulfonate/bicarbonate transport system ATPase subunit
VFITHSISEAVEIGDVVLRRPAIIAYDVSFDKDTPLEGRMMIRSGSEKFWRLSLRQLKHAPMPSTELTA